MELLLNQDNCLNKDYMLNKINYRSKLIFYNIEIHKFTYALKKRLLNKRLNQSYFLREVLQYKEIEHSQLNQVFILKV